MYHDHGAFDRVSRAMRKANPPTDRTAVVIPELIERLDALFASRVAKHRTP